MYRGIGNFCAVSLYLIRYSDEVLEYNEPDFHDGFVYALSVHGCGGSF